MGREARACSHGKMRGNGAQKKRPMENDITSDAIHRNTHEHITSQYPLRSCHFSVCCKTRMHTEKESKHPAHLHIVRAAARTTRSSYKQFPTKYLIYRNAYKAVLDVTTAQRHTEYRAHTNTHTLLFLYT